LWDTSSKVITEGPGADFKGERKGKDKIRKGAMMCTMSCWHPCIEEFITAKQTPGRLTKFNMSCLIYDDFMHAVENHLPWDLKFPDYESVPEEYNKLWDGNLKKWEDAGLPVKIYKTIEDANTLWDLIMVSTYNRNEPGVLFIDTINRLNNLHYCEHIAETNPCLTGEMEVYVADGRGYVPIKQLANENKDVPVFCLNDDDVPVVRYMRNPRVTGYNVPIYKVTLDDGTVLRCTDNHKFKLLNGSYREAKFLKNGDSLFLLTREEANMENVITGKVSESDNYLWLQTSYKKSKIQEHRLIAAFHHLDGDIKDIPQGHVVHHKDINSKKQSSRKFRNND
jgi:ribonucleotide reductase alpha subunit